MMDDTRDGMKIAPRTHHGAGIDIPEPPKGLTWVVKVGGAVETSRRESRSQVTANTPPPAHAAERAHRLRDRHPTPEELRRLRFQRGTEMLRDVIADANLTITANRWEPPSINKESTRD